MIITENPLHKRLQIRCPEEKGLIDHHIAKKEKKKKKTTKTKPIMIWLTKSTESNRVSYPLHQLKALLKH